MQELLLMENMSKSYPGSKALKNGRIEVEKSEIHALIGANCAYQSKRKNGEAFSG